MPYTLADLPFFLALPVLLAASGFFSGSETALFGLSAHDRLRLVRGGTLTGRLVGALLADERRLLVTLMLGNMLANVLYFVVTAALVLRLEAGAAGGLGIVLASVAPLGLIILLGEVAPKMLASTAAPRWVRVTALPLYGVHRVAGPAGHLLGRWVIQPLGRLFAPPRGAAELSTAELGALLEMSRSRGVIRSDEQQMLREVIQLGERRVRDVMVPRVDIRAIDVHEPPHKLRELIDRTRLGKYIAMDRDVDHVLGVIYTRQFLLASRLGMNVNLRNLVRGVRFVPETQRVDQLLDSFRKTATKLAVVVDEYGGTAGLVTMKDVVEQLVGDLDMDQAPGESPRPIAEQLGPRKWRVSGRLSAHDWAAAFAAEALPPRVATVGGLVMALLGRVPRPGDRVRLGNVELAVERMDGGRVESATIRLLRRHQRHRLAGGRAARQPPDRAAGGGR